MLNKLIKASFLGIFLFLNLNFIKSSAAGNNCNTLAMQKYINDQARNIIIDDWVFPAPIGVDANIESCQYFSGENAYLVRTIVEWTGPLEGRYYKSEVKFTIENNTYSWELLMANDNLRRHFFENAIWIKGLEALADQSDSTSLDNGYYLVCIRNKVNNEIKFSYRWTSADEWENYSVEKKGGIWLSNTSDNDLELEFDSSFADGYQKTIYNLEGKITQTQNCNNISGYYFKMSNDGESINFYSD
ncbi:MAG: hypothetical protein AAGA80_26380 [Cyanobacteria bacterium P01_F01_bin.143]